MNDLVLGMVTETPGLPGRSNHHLKLPLDAVTRTFGIAGQRGAGKSSLGMVMGAQMCEAGLSFVAIDKVGCWRGLKHWKDGTPAYKVVVIGGKNGDLPLEPGSGRQVATAVCTAVVPVVIDLFGIDTESQKRFVKDFMVALQTEEPARPTHVFLEEAAEFAPQDIQDKISKQCCYAVSQLATLGRNWGWGFTALFQRPAMVSKNVLSQCETLLVLRTSGAHDRKALETWMSGHGEVEDLKKTIHELASLKDGEGWCWSPNYLGMPFVKFRSSDRKTFHPGETRKVNAVKPTKFEAVDVSAFVDTLRAELSSSTLLGESEDGKRTKRATTHAPAKPSVERAKEKKVERDTRELDHLKSRLSIELEARKKAEVSLAAARTYLEPQYNALKAVFEDMGAAPMGAAPINSSKWAKWIERAKSDGIGETLNLLIDSRRLRQKQLATLSGISPRTWVNRRAWLTKNNLAVLDGEDIVLVEL